MGKKKKSDYLIFTGKDSSEPGRTAYIHLYGGPELDYFKVKKRIDNNNEVVEWGYYPRNVVSPKLGNMLEQTYNNGNIIRVDGKRLAWETCFSLIPDDYADNVYEYNGKYYVRLECMHDFEVDMRKPVEPTGPRYVQDESLMEWNGDHREIDWYTDPDLSTDRIIKEWINYDLELEKYKERRDKIHNNDDYKMSNGNVPKKGDCYWFELKPIRWKLCCMMKWVPKYKRDCLYGWFETNDYEKNSDIMSLAASFGDDNYKKYSMLPNELKSFLDRVALSKTKEEYIEDLKEEKNNKKEKIIILKEEIKQLQRQLDALRKEEKAPKRK